MRIYPFTLLPLFLLLLPISTLARPFVLVLSQEDLQDSLVVDPTYPPSSEPDFDDFTDSPARPDYDLDPGSWTPLFEPGPNNLPEAGPDREYYGLVGRMVEGATRGDLGEVEEAVREIEGLAERGEAHSKSVLGFMYRFGIFKEKNKGKSFLYHHFAASDGNLQSKMALAYTYY